MMNFRRGGWKDGGVLLQKHLRARQGHVLSPTQGSVPWTAPQGEHVNFLHFLPSLKLDKSLVVSASA